MKLKDIYLFVMNGDFKKYTEDKNIEVTKVQLKCADIVFGSVGFFPGCDKRVVIPCLIDGIMNSLKSTIVEQYITDKRTLHNDNYTLVIYDYDGKSYKIDDDVIEPFENRTN